MKRTANKNSSSPYVDKKIKVEKIDEVLPRYNLRSRACAPGAASTSLEPEQENKPIKEEKLVSVDFNFPWSKPADEAVASTSTMIEENKKYIKLEKSESSDFPHHKPGYEASASAPEDIKPKIKQENIKAEPQRRIYTAAPYTYPPQYKPKDRVVAKIGMYPVWPGKIVRLADEINGGFRNYHVLLYGAKKTVLAEEHNIIPWDDYIEGKRKIKNPETFMEGYHLLTRHHKH